MSLKEATHYTNFMEKGAFFRAQKVGWKLLGFWIGSDSVSKIKYWALIFNCIYVIIYGIFQFWYCLAHRNNIRVFLDALTPFITQFPVVVRILILVWHRNDLKMVLDYLKNIFENATDYDEKILNAKANQMASVLLGVMWFCCISTDLGYIIYPIAANLYRHFAGQPIVYDLPFKAIFPFEYDYFPMYFIIYIISTHSGNVTAVSLGAGEGMILGSCYHLSAQLEIISSRIRKLSQQAQKGHQNSATLFTREENNEIYKKLLELINFHNEAIDKCKVLSKVLWLHILSQMVSASFIMCISALVILTSRDLGVLINIFYINAYFAMLFNYAMSGNALISASTGIQHSAYDFPWYRCDNRVRKALLLIMIRGQREVNLSVPFFKINLETFSAVLRVFSSFFTLAKTFM